MSPRITSIVLLILAVILLGATAGSVDARAATGPSIGTDRGGRDQPTQRPWRTPFGRHLVRHMNAREWSWVAHHSQSPDLTERLRRMRNVGKARLSGRCEINGPRRGLCYYDRGFIVAVHRMNSGKVIAVSADWLS